MKKVVLIGYTGMLGRGFYNAFKQGYGNYDVKFLSRRDINFYDTSSIVKKIPQTDIIINCAGWTDVRNAETCENRAIILNGEAVQELTKAAIKRDAVLVHFSTDYVFSGESIVPYKERDCLNPINAYGRSKLLGENIIRLSGCRNLLIRTSGLYAPWGHNFIKTIYKKLYSKKVFEVVDDQKMRPTSVISLVNATLKLIDDNELGIYHITDSGPPCSWHELASFIAGSLNFDCHPLPCKSDKFNKYVQRPPYSVLDISKTEAVVGNIPSWKHNVKTTLLNIGVNKNKKPLNQQNKAELREQNYILERMYNKACMHIEDLKKELAERG